MKRYSPILPAVIILLVLFPVKRVFAIEPYDYYPSYVDFKAGVFLPQSNDLDSSGNSLSGELALGARFSNHFAAEVAIGAFSVDEIPFSGFNQSGEFSTGTADVTLFPVTINLKFIYPIQSADLYLEGGGGIFIAQGDLTATTGSSAVFDTLSDFPFGFQIGLGGEIPVNPQVFAGLDVRYIYTRADFDVDSFTISGMAVSAIIGYRF